MRNTLFCLGLLMFSTLGLFAQTEEPKTLTPDPAPSQQENPFSQFEELFQGLQLGDMGDGMMIDTMILRQFGGSDLGGVEMDQMMQEMMQMMQQQMQGFDFGDMQGFDQLLEGFSLDSLNLNQMPLDSLGQIQRVDSNKPKTYKL